MGKMHLMIIAAGLALLAGCAETAIFKDPKTGEYHECAPICRPQPQWVLIVASIKSGGPHCEKQTNDSCIAAYTDLGYVRLTGDAADECRSHATSPYGNLDDTRFRDCMNDMVRRRR
jgi:hypothetical protein